MNARDSEIVTMRSELDDKRKEFEDILGTKMALDTEIAIYKTLLDEEEKRVSRLKSSKCKVIVDFIEIF